MGPQKKLPPAVAALIVIVLIGLIAAAVVAVRGQNNTTAPADTSTPQTESSTNNSQSSTPSTSTYKDGTYSATGSYATPGGQESIKLSVTLKDGEITSSDLTQNAITGQAMEYQQRFASGYKGLVVGKKIDSVSLSRVAGSSLTSAGFNSALDQIKSDAAA